MYIYLAKKKGEKVFALAVQDGGFPGRMKREYPGSKVILIGTANAEVPPVVLGSVEITTNVRPLGLEV